MHHDDSDYPFEEFCRDIFVGAVFAGELAAAASLVIPTKANRPRQTALTAASDNLFMFETPSDAGPAPEFRCLSGAWRTPSKADFASASGQIPL